MTINPPWTYEDILAFVAAWDGGETLGEIAARFGRTEGSILAKAQALALPKRAGFWLGNVSEATVTRADAIEQDRRFKLAMLAARRAGRERFTLGVVAEPCTASPVFIDPRTGADAGGGCSALADF